MTNDELELNRLQGALQDRYQLKRVLGRGGMATVYLAEDPRHSRHLALKVLRPELAATIGADRFLREIRTIASLTHPHILPLFDSGKADGLLFYVMPYVEGETLRHRIKRERQLPLADAIQIAREVADALSFAHGRGIVHRDIKPENILLEAGHAVVADFGIAKAITVAAGDELTNLGFAIGTPQYMSPEQATADPSVDGRSDLYSLGCVVFEMLAGVPPFSNSSPSALLTQKLLATAPRITPVSIGVPESVQIAVARSLRRVPSERYQTMLEFADALTVDPEIAPRSMIGSHAGIGVAGKDLPRLPLEIRPLDDELDFYGLTHPGKIERVNQDHFALCSIRREIHFHQTSLPDASRVPRKGERRAFVAIVADGMGRGAWGEQASRSAIEILTQQLMHSIRTYSMATPEDESSFVNSLHAMALQCQMSVEERNWENSGAHGAAFGLTMWVGIWPRGYVVEIGPGRVYQFFDGNLFRLSATSELDEPSRLRHMEATGTIVMTPGNSPSSSAANVRFLPIIYRHEQQWTATGLICSRGLTDYVSEDRIAERLRESTSAKQACEALLEDALASGGAQNITIVVGRAMAQPS